MAISEITEDTLIEVRNSETGEDILPNALEHYFNEKYNSSVFSSSICPSCGKKMYRKKECSNCNDNDIMVGGHVESTVIPPFKFLVPMCKECNDKKLNLPPFKVKLGYLLSLLFIKE